ncbi:MAG: ATP-dependent sacrificial sulfur transferase LarE [Planctomycetota bacterium]
MGSIPTIGSVDLRKKHNSLKKILSDLQRVVLAYSGGVDSTLLLKVAVDTLGTENVLACIAVSPSLARSQHEQAIELAQKIGATLKEIDLEELSDPNYSANKADRCFHCKSHVFSLLADIAKENNFNHVICGHNFDDKDDYRPGSRAAEVFKVRSPLAEAQMTKDDIRQLSRQLDLPTAELPASPCLASRVSYGLEITARRLKQIEQAEDYLKQFGLVEFRVRHHDQLARIEIRPDDFEKVMTEPARSKIIEKIKSLGFKFVTLDMQGFRSGSLNEMLDNDEKQRNL